MDEDSTLQDLYETRRQIEALRDQGEPTDSPRLKDLRRQHGDLLAALNEHSIVPIAWEDDWRPSGGQESSARMARRPADRIGRLSVVLALVAIVVWSLLLFGIGLDDVTRQNTHPGVILSIVVLPILIGGAAYGLWRLVVPHARRRASD